ncbi:MAG: hypothetical protein ACKOYL_02955, partial [Actinomycetota bacterium]
SLTIPKSLRVGQSRTITAPGSENVDGLAVTVEVQTPKICTTQNSTKGVILRATKAGACRLRIQISGDSEFNGVSYSATVQVR